MPSSGKYKETAYDVLIQKWYINKTLPQKCPHSPKCFAILYNVFEMYRHIENVHPSEVKHNLRYICFNCKFLIKFF